MSRNAMLLLLAAAAAVQVVQAQHLFLAGGGLNSDSEFFWNKLVQLGVSYCF